MSRRRLMQSQGGELPSGYVRCKYIMIINDESNDYNNGILTPLYWDEINKIKFNIQSVSINYYSHNNGIMLFSSAPATRVPSPPCVGLLFNNKKLSEYVSGLSDYVAVPDITYSHYSSKEPYDICISFNCTKHNEVTFGCWYDMYYSHTNNWGIVEFFDTTGKNVCRYIPALDPSGRPCMYDTVTQQPFYNQGTGEFGYELLDGTYIAPV